HEPSDPLARTKPLSDPVRTITLLMVAGAIIVGVVTAIFFVKAYGPFGAVLSLALTCCTVSFAMLLGPVGRPNAIYLRAFRTDRSTARLRAELGAILGPKFRLSGIRPPQRKTSLFLRFLVPGLVAMRYAGSKFMELEAGDDWMARLWKTYQTTRLVFIDLRDVTVHVHHEIQMTMATMGAERCIFVVDASKSADDWRETIAAIAGPQFDARTFKLLDASEERIRSWALAAELKVLLNSLPPGVPGETDRGRQFILEHVPENLLEQSRRVSVTNVLSGVLGLGLSLGFGLFAGREHPFLLLPFIVFGLVVTAWAVARTLARIARLARAGHRGAALRVVLLLGLAGLPFLTSILATTIAVPALIKSKKMAEETSAIASLRTLETAEVMYESTYPDQGFACQLSQLGGDPRAGAPSAQAAQLIGNDLTSGKKAGYEFAIAKCTRTVVNGREQAEDFLFTAVPVPADGRRGFCVDASGEIRVDPQGGTNCTRLLPE
ncbi:MAG: hypothetical protein WBA18_11055, partial [Terracidiphilus sp.]